MERQEVWKATLTKYLVDATRVSDRELFERVGIDLSRAKRNEEVYRGWMRWIMSGLGWKRTTVRVHGVVMKGWRKEEIREAEPLRKLRERMDAAVWNGVEKE